MNVRVSRKEPSSNGVSATQNKGTLVISLLGNGERQAQRCSGENGTYEVQK